MAKREVIATIILSFFLITSFASAADVAYIYRNPSQIDNNTISVFEELGLAIDLIRENSLPRNLSNYKLIYVGDENFRNEKNIPVNDYPAIVSNRRHLSIWGITTSDGASQLGATRPLSVLTNTNKIIVYTEAMILTKVAIPYYFLHERNKAPAMEQVAATETMSSGFKIGDVVSHAKAGVEMANGMKSFSRNVVFANAGCLLMSGWWNVYGLFSR